MIRQINLVSKNANESYTLTYPQNMMNFLKFDFTIFMEKCTDLCNTCTKTGEFLQDEANTIRASISGCHKYYEQNMRTVFDKIVVDFFIEYICRQNEMGVNSLWASCLDCKTPFEQAMFSRISQYRHNHAINQWVNILRIQEYATKKVDFIFGTVLKNAEEAASRANYFDVMFNVAANEMGYDNGKLGAVKLAPIGRVPSSPFILSGTSKEIMHNVFKNIIYPEVVVPERAESLTDKSAMDAFAVIKPYIPSETDFLINTVLKSLTKLPTKVYMPENFKSVIDLEIDVMIESGALLQRCLRCRQYYVKDDEYNYDYCDKTNKDGYSCLDIMTKDSKSDLKDVLSLSAKCDALAKEMSDRVNISLTQYDFAEWYHYLLIIKEKVVNGDTDLDDFNSFADYSRALKSVMTTPTILKKPPVEAEKKPIEEPHSSEVATEVGNVTAENVPVEQIIEPHEQKIYTVPASQLSNKLPKATKVSTKNQATSEPKLFVFEHVSRAKVDESISNSSAEIAQKYQTPLSGRIIKNSVQPFENIMPQNFGEVAPQLKAVDIPTTSVPKPKVDNIVINSVDISTDSFVATDKKEESTIQFDNIIDEDVYKQIIPNSHLNNNKKHFTEENVVNKEIVKKPYTDKEEGESKAAYEAVAHNDNSQKSMEDDIEIVAKSPKSVRKKYAKKKPEMPIVPPLENDIAEAQVELDIPIGNKTTHALFAYKTAAEPTTATDEEESFSTLLESMERKDGFQVQEDESVSHKTKHVMDAIFKPTNKQAPVFGKDKKD